jgi:kynurenine formamidase
MHTPPLHMPHEPAPPSSHPAPTFVPRPTCPPHPRAPLAIGLHPTALHPTAPLAAGLLATGILLAGGVLPADGGARADEPRPPAVIDLSLTVAADLPCVWPVGMTPLAVVPTATFGRTGRHRDMLVIDEHTGTQWDAPAHFVPPPGSSADGAGPMGLVTGEKVPAWQFCGAACVIDLTKHRDEAAPGESFLIGPEHVRAWELAHRPVGPGDVVCFRTGYTDAYYAPFPAGERFVADSLRKKTPGWAAPTPETMTYLADRGVMTLVSDGASMGPLPNLAVATHQAGGRRGMVWVECATNLDSLPATGGFVAILPAKHAGGSGGECRLLAVTEPKLAATLVARARAKHVVDLSVTLDENLPVVWPGWSPGEEGGRYIAKVLNAFSKERGPFFALGHLFDSFAGTHVVLPSFALPADRAEIAAAEPAIRAAVAAYELRHGPLGTSALRTAEAPLETMMGPAHVVDVRGLVGTAVVAAGKPASPLVTAEWLDREAARRPFLPGEVVLFCSGHTDRTLRPLPAAPAVEPCFAMPLAGTAEGWPALAPEAVAWLAGKGVRCLGTDGPTLGGVDPEIAREVEWLAGSRGLVVVEMLTGLAAIADREAFFLFAPIKIGGTRGGYGRALALLANGPGGPP